MKAVSKILVFLFVIGGIYGCTAPIEINTDDADPRLVIFGYITNQPGVNSIRISSTNGYFNNNRPPVISGAEVSISYDGITVPLTEDSDTLGLYMTGFDFHGRDGKTYTLDVKLDFDGDGVKEHYRAEATIPLSTRVDSVKLQPSLLPFMPNLLLYGYVPESQSNNLALYLIKNNKPVNVLDYFLIIPDWYFKGNDIYGYQFPCLVEDGILAGDTITFRVASFTDDFSEFISHSSSAAGGSNPLFGGPPSDVKTNIRVVDSNNEVEVVGYFSAFSTSEKFTISDRDYQR